MEQIHRTLILLAVFSILFGGVLAGLYAQSLDGENAPEVIFVDVAENAGLTALNVWGGVDTKRYIIEAKGSGLGFIDYDNDGWIDIYVTNGIRFGETYTAETAPISHLYKNNRDGSFTDVTTAAGVGRTGWQTGVCVGDYNNDGWDDLYAGFWGHSVLFQNSGDGTFTDVTREAGLYTEEVKWGSGCTWVDYDRDGDLDLYTANYIELDVDKVPAPGENADCIWKGIPVPCGPRGLPGAADVLYRNRGDGTFTDVSEQSGIASAGPGYAITSVSADFNNDNWPDIYVAVDSEPSLLFSNNQDGTFEEVGVLAGCGYSGDGRVQAGMGIGVGDFNCDGWLDIFKTNFQDETCNLYQSNGDGTFTDVIAVAGIGRNTQYVNWGAGFVDYDNDAWVDILYVTGHVYPRVDRHNVDTSLKTPRIVYRNLGNGKFRDVSAQMGPGVAQRFASRGCAFGDYDNDGDVDVVVLNMNDRFSLLRCDGGNENSWIKLKLIGTHCNRSAIGARVRVVTGDHSQIREVRSGGSVMSQDDLRLHFGLAQAETVDLIEVRWPTTDAVERFRKIEVDQILTIKEGSGIIAPGRSVQTPSAETKAP
jgi:hypothetical protein